MQLAHLSEEETQEVILRASEIAGMHAKPDSGTTSVEAFLVAATEAGIPRAALEQALRERSITTRTWTEGERVFAKSADGNYYLATIDSASEASYHVKFLRGGQAVVAIDEVISGQLLPGQRVVCDWPAWGPWDCTVVSYDDATETIRASDGWMSIKSFPVAEVRITPPRTKKSRNKAFSIWMYGACALAGGAMGSAITWWLSR